METQAASAPVVESEVEVATVEPSLTADEHDELEHLRSFKGRLSVLKNDAKEARLRVEELRLELKDAKQSCEAANAAIQRAIEEDENDANRPLLNQLDASSSSSADEEDTSYRLVSIDTLGLSAKICELLRENNPPLATIGAIQDWLGDADHVLQDVKGLGTAKVTQVEEALDKFWKRWREQQNAK